jgi:hypothetical protein
MMDMAHRCLKYVGKFDTNSVFGSWSSKVHTTLYIYDTTNKIRNRLHSLDAEDFATRSLSPSIVNALMPMLDEHNPFVKKLRTARDAEDFATRSLSPSIVNALMRMLDEHNPFVKKIRTAREITGTS